MLIEMLRKHDLLAFACSLALATLAACGGSDAASSSIAPTAPVVAGSQLLAPAAADSLLRNPPAELVIIDVRTPEEFAAGHIAGAVDVDLNGATFQSDVAKLDPATPYFVYCHSGNRSAQAVAYLRQQGFSSLYELQGGIAAWQTAGLPLVTA